jgi:hypothetical protein
VIDVVWVLPRDPVKSGGPLVARRISELIASQSFQGKLVVEDNNSSQYPSLESALSASASHATVFAVTYGPMVPKHIAAIRQRSRAPILYYAQSFGWRSLRGTAPNSYRMTHDDIDIVCNSRYVMAQWNSHAPANRTAYIPPPLSAAFGDHLAERDIDVLVHTRKQSSYCTERLIPALEQRGLRVHRIESWVPQEQLAVLLNRTKVFLYVVPLVWSGWLQYPLGEGFGLPPLEALACGAQVASNLLGGVNDFLEPEVNCVKVRARNPDEDVSAIQQALDRFEPNPDASRRIREAYSEPSVTRQWHNLLQRWYG